MVLCCPLQALPGDIFTHGFEGGPGIPDLVVINPGVSESTLTTSQAYTIDATARNQGSAAAAASTLRYYQSTDNVISTSDLQLGTDAIAGLAPGANSAQSLPATAPASPGTFWVGACADAVAGEFNTANQCSLAVQITVAAATVPDLVVIDPGVSDATLTASQAYTISATARNQGDAASAASTLRYYQSADNVISTSDVQLGTDAIPVLAPAGNSPQNLPANAPASDGSWWVGACVDAVAGESNTANQCSAGVQITVFTDTDTDNDRLPDWVETNTGVYVSATNTGTDPNNPDTDDDSIGDGDEVLGTLAGLDLPAMGVSPVRKDLLMEYDWFDDNLDSGTCSAHSHRPTVASIASASTAFNNSPVPNPSAVNGVNLINDYGQGGAFTGGNLIADPNGVIAGGIGGAEYQAHKAANFAANRNGYFHYVLLPHRYNTTSSSSGQAEVPGDDLIVSLYCAHSDSNVANTILHELGHNLILRHGGNENCNYKPNYNSVMNYRYQFPGVDNNCTPPGDGVLDYSYGNRIDLNENSLNENNGVCGPGNPWDWNGNGPIENPVSFNINPYENELPECGTTLTSQMRDYDDWGSLYFGGILDADRALPMRKEFITEQPVPAEFR
jgi:hypothetical protein